MARLVEAVSEQKSIDGVELPWEERKEHKLAHLRAGGPGVAARKAADAIHNVHSIAADLRSVGPSVWGRFKRGPEPTLGYYRAILDGVRAKLGEHPIVAELAAAIDEIVEVVLARMRPRLAGYTVTADLPPHSAEISVDPVQMDQVLTNLLENAGRHSPPGGEITVSVRWIPGAVLVKVADEGPGIPLGERERVFEAFYSGASSPETPGSGLGLAIAKAVVVAHGGGIWIEDRPGGGCVVAFQIPVEDTLP